MAKINENYLKLKAGYLFPEIARRVREFQSKNPECKIIRMGIGDVTLPLTHSVIEAFHKAVNEMSKKETFKGYGPEQGYEFLREAIATYEYKNKGINIKPEEIFISDGSKCDTGNIQEIFSEKSVVAITDPVYPVYVDTTVMSGKTDYPLPEGRFPGIVYLPCTEENNFIPSLPDQKVDLIFLCYPNNPTGTTLSKEELKKWVDYAKENKSIILFDAAYEAFIQEDNIPHSIYEIEGAREVAIEFRSFSKTAGFTGTRCAYTVIPENLIGYTEKGEEIPLHRLWLRRQTTKFNGVSYPVQKAAAAIYTNEGRKEIKELIDYYMGNAKIIRESLEKIGFRVYGGINAPYIWVKDPQNRSSWDLFDFFLEKANVVATPGSGFGPAGENYIRFSAFADRENVIEAMERIKKLFNI